MDRGIDPEIPFHVRVLNSCSDADIVGLKKDYCEGKNDLYEAYTPDKPQGGECAEKFDYKKVSCGDYCKEYSLFGECDTITTGEAYCRCYDVG